MTTLWRALDHDGCDYGDDAKRCVCDADGTRLFVVDDEAMAAQIVREHNAHEALVKVVTFMLERQDTHLKVSLGEEFVIDVFELSAMRAALKLAKKGP